VNSTFNHRPDRVLAIAYAIVVTSITFSSTIELFGNGPGGRAVALPIAMQTMETEA
jgi:hypothetical protein